MWNIVPFRPVRPCILLLLLVDGHGLAVVLVSMVMMMLSQCSNPYLCLRALQDARKAQLENHEPEDEEEDLDKDLQDSGQFFVVCCFSTRFYCCWFMACV